MTVAEASPSALGEGRVRVSGFAETCDPHPALRATLSQWERDRPVNHSHLHRPPLQCGCVVRNIGRGLRRLHGLIGNGYMENCSRRIPIQYFSRLLMGLRFKSSSVS